MQERIAPQSAKIAVEPSVFASAGSIDNYTTMERRSQRNSTPTARLLASQAIQLASQQRKRPRALSRPTEGSPSPDPPPEVPRARNSTRLKLLPPKNPDSPQESPTRPSDIVSAARNALQALNSDQVSGFIGADDDSEEENIEEEEEAEKGEFRPPPSAQVDPNTTKRRRSDQRISSPQRTPSPTNSEYSFSKVSFDISIDIFVGKIREFSK